MRAPPTKVRGPGASQRKAAEARTVTRGSTVETIDASAAPIRDRPAKKATIATAVETTAMAATQRSPAADLGGSKPPARVRRPKTRGRRQHDDRGGLGGFALADELGPADYVEGVDTCRPHREEHARISPRPPSPTMRADPDSARTRAIALAPVTRSFKKTAARAVTKAG